MSGFIGVLVSDPWLQSQFTQVELMGLNSKYLSTKGETGQITVEKMPPLMAKLKGLNNVLTKEDISTILAESNPDTSKEIDFESFLRAYLNLQSRAAEKVGGKKNTTSFLKATTTTLLHTISQSEKASYVAHINNHLGEDRFLKKYLPIDPATNGLFDLAKDGVLLCKLINVAVPGTIDERAINTKQELNPWERNENHTLCLNSAKAIGCTVVNIGEQDLVEGRPHLLLGLISQIIKIQLLADLNLKKTPQLVELVEDGKDVEELLSLPPEKMLLKWMNFHLQKAGYKKTVTNFSSDVKDGEAYAYLLNALAPEHSSTEILDTKDPTARAQMVIEQAEKLDCKRYVTPKDIVDGSSNLNLAFVAQVFQHRNGLSADTKKISAAPVDDDVLVSREEKSFRMWINSLGIATYVNNLFEDVRNGWVLLEVLDKVSPGSVKWKQASKPPIKMPFRKVENCNQVIRIGKELNFSLVNVAGNDIVQGNKKLILAFLWQLMRSNILKLLKNLRGHSLGKEITDVDILNWANRKVKKSGRTSQMDSFKDRNLSNGIFFLELLSAVKPRVVNWKLVTKGEDASIMYWSLQNQPADNSAPPSPPSEPSADGEDESAVTESVENLTINDTSS
ncbi:uncharacterized protein A4U43_C05F20870 [Asparagus officinalis]|uniref:Calponin-homology (CH) domain-containing protein n=1 Tax=Asparagus officinalis TaxID=4686 RepID=A0A5P1ET76_ASPOF|nr:uncharacterized protein A4U43_C05F20870 [Asparagus officinalis]